MDAFSVPSTNQDKSVCSKQEAAPELQMSFPQTRAVPHLFSSDIVLVSQSESECPEPSQAPREQSLGCIVIV